MIFLTIAHTYIHIYTILSKYVQQRCAIPPKFAYQNPDTMIYGCPQNIDTYVHTLHDIRMYIADIKQLD